MTGNTQGWIAFVVFMSAMLVWLTLEPTDSYYECETASGQHIMCVTHNK